MATTGKDLCCCRKGTRCGKNGIAVLALQNRCGLESCEKSWTESVSMPGHDVKKNRKGGTAVFLKK